MSERSLARAPDLGVKGGESTSNFSKYNMPTQSAPNGSRKRLLIVAPHVVQYSSPLFRHMAHHPELDLLVSYCSMQGAEAGVDSGFGVKVSWDTPLLEGYSWTYVPNRAWRAGSDHFFGLFNPGLWPLIRDGNFDAVLICGYYFATAWIALCAAKSFGVPVIFVSDSHGLQSWRARSAWRLRFKKRLVRWIFSLSQAVVVSSSGGVEYLKSLGYPANQISLAPTSVNNSWWIEETTKADRNAVRVAWGIPVEDSVALFCGKLQPWKGPADLLDAFARSRVPNSYLVFVGEGPERENLVRKSIELGIADRVRFLGFLNQSQLPSAYSAADVFVLPSMFEPFGMVVNEAMLCGLPVVVSDRVGARFDLVRPGENGYVFPAGDAEALAAVLRELLPDPEKRAHMGNAAKRRMETWSPREYTDGMVRAVEMVRRTGAGLKR
jgi:glycosyltransferase involved in cell wall biosynthesis